MLGLCVYAPFKPGGDVIRVYAGLITLLSLMAIQASTRGRVQSLAWPKRELVGTVSEVGNHRILFVLARNSRIFFRDGDVPCFSASPKVILESVPGFDSITIYRVFI